MTAVVVTHRRPRLATRTVEMLLDKEGIHPSDIVLVVNGEGGLEDAALERSIDLLQLEVNLGPAGGFREGLLRAYEAHSNPWLYVCEDDITLFEPVTPRLPSLLGRVASQPDLAQLGAVVAYGRRLDMRTGLTYPYLVDNDKGFRPVDVAAWGATLLRREILEIGILPDGELFFGFEDFDFFLSIKKAGFDVWVDAEASYALQQRVFFDARDTQLRASRPVDSEEAWRRYYSARNFFKIARKHGDLRWQLWHIAKSLRRLQLLGRSGRKAYLVGLKHGVEGRLGKNENYLPRLGEYPG